MIHAGTVVVDTPQLLNAVPIKMEVKRYVPQRAEEVEGGLTLVFAHGTTSCASCILLMFDESCYSLF